MAQADTAVATSTADLARRVRRLEIRAKRLVADRLFGQYSSVFRGRGLEFAEVRAYQPGDDVRIIDWNVTARMGVPYVKRFVEERELTVMIALDVSGSQQFGTANATKAELGIELAALLSFAAVANNDLVGLLTFTDQIETFVQPAKGPRHALRILRDAVGCAAAGRGTSISAAVSYLQRAVRRRAVIFLISDFLDEGYESTLRYAARRHDVVAIALSDPRESELTPVGLAELEDAETGDRVWLDTNDRSARGRYAEEAKARAENRRQLITSLGVDVVPVVTDRDYVAPLTTYLRARARRR